MLDRHRALNPANQAVLPPAEAAYCASLPSSTAAYRALSGGGIGAWGEVAGSTILRAALISAGLFVLDRKNQKVLVQGLAGATAIEVFVLGWTWWKMPR